VIAAAKGPRIANGLPYLTVLLKIGTLSFREKEPVYSGLPEESGSKIVETPPPGQPLVSGTGRFEIDVLDTGFDQVVAEILGVRAFCGSDSQKEDLDPSSEGSVTSVWPGQSGPGDR